MVGGSSPLGHANFGGLAERFKALVSKTSGRKPSEVRILYPPLSPDEVLTKSGIHKARSPRSLMDRASASGAGDVSSILAEGASLFMERSHSWSSTCVEILQSCLIVYRIKLWQG